MAGTLRGSRAVSPEARDRIDEYMLTQALRPVELKRRRELVERVLAKLEAESPSGELVTVQEPPC